MSDIISNAIKLAGESFMETCEARQKFLQCSEPATVAELTRIEAHLSRAHAKIVAAISLAAGNPEPENTRGDDADAASCFPNIPMKEDGK